MGWGNREAWNRTPDEENYHSVLDLCASARRVIGLTPIEPRIQIQSYWAENLEDVKIMEIDSHLSQWDRSGTSISSKGGNRFFFCVEKYFFLFSLQI